MTRCPTCGHHNGGHADDCDPPADPYALHRSAWVDDNGIRQEPPREDDPNAGTDYHAAVNR